MIDNLPGREVMGQKSPRAVGLHQIQNGIEGHPTLVFGWPSSALRHRKQLRVSPMGPSNRWQLLRCCGMNGGPIEKGNAQ